MLTNSHPQALGRDGFTLLEVILAIALLAGAALGLTQMMAEDTRRTQNREATQAAQMIALNEVERLRATHPWAVPESTSWSVDEFGNLVASPSSHSGPIYRIELQRAITCDGGRILLDNRHQPLYTGGCESVNDQRPTATYTLRVIHPSRLRESGIDTITHRVKVGPVGRFSNNWTPATAP